MFEIEVAAEVRADLKKIRPYDRNLVLDAIAEQLRHEPDRETKNRKQVPCLIPTFEAIPPIWELRVGSYRVFYDVDREEKKVYVRAVRKKPPHRRTEEIL